MLVLTRKERERICIGDDIVIEVTDIRSGRVRIGIIAPANVKVMREELRNGAKRSAAIGDTEAAEKSSGGESDVSLAIGNI